MALGDYIGSVHLVDLCCRFGRVHGIPTAIMPRLLGTKVTTPMVTLYTMSSALRWPGLCWPSARVASVLHAVRPDMRPSSLLLKIFASVHFIVDSALL